MKPELYHYTLCGLDNVWLENGYEILETPYGEAVQVHDTEGLDRAIALSLIDCPSRLSGKEIRFLRQMMGMSQRDFAALIGTTDQTLARWEKEQHETPETADKLIRVDYRAFDKGDGPITDIIASINFKDRVCNEKIVLTETEGEWQAHDCTEPAAI